MTKMLEEGQYVYVPAETLMFIFNEGTCATFSKCHKIAEPSYLMFLRPNENDERYYDVFYEGDVWSIGSQLVYEAGETNESTS
tara:strand:+ start:1376 stop:1624 length:249 start_codon:yes stop_codon:yes gene_type:complete